MKLPVVLRSVRVPIAVSNEAIGPIALTVAIGSHELALRLYRWTLVAPSEIKIPWSCPERWIVTYELDGLKLAASVGAASQPISFSPSEAKENSCFEEV